MIQLDLFEPLPDELSSVKEELRNLKESHDKVRRSLFKKYADISKLYLEQKQEIEKLKWLLSSRLN
jgi:DNA-binding ferritin-like protein